MPRRFLSWMAQMRLLLSGVLLSGAAFDERRSVSDGGNGANWRNPVDCGSAANVSAKAVDVAIIEALRNMPGARGTNFVSRTVAKFITNARVNLASVEDAIAASDCTSVRRIAHGLKSSSGFLGAKQLAELCAALERAALEGDMRSCADLAYQLYHEFNRAEIELQAHL